MQLNINLCSMDYKFLKLFLLQINYLIIVLIPIYGVSYVFKKIFKTPK